MSFDVLHIGQFTDNLHNSLFQKSRFRDHTLATADNIAVIEFLQIGNICFGYASLT